MGTPAGTERVVDVNSGPAGSYPRFLTSFDGYLYFSAYTAFQGRELWRTTGAAEEAILVSPGAVPAGTSDAVVMIAGSSQDKGINPGILDSDPSDLLVVGDKLIFAATSRTSGRELWTVGVTTNDMQSKAMGLVD